ncbi:MAG: cation transporter [Erysipelotrichaceae bacterium]|nr:cation transporter [Erysipelotrichaceae bacterium]
MELTREQAVQRTSIIGIVVNVVLSAFKAITGLLSGSIAIVLDAVNNLSDALSSTITIIGMKLASKPADRDHPLGHGRAEYLSALIVSAIIFGVGLTSFRESLEKIIHGSNELNFDFKTYLIMIVAIIAKLLLGMYTRKMGRQYHSDSLVASGSDAMFDSIITTSTVVAAIFYTITKINIDGYLGIVISVLILKTGYEMISEAVSEMLGRRTDPELIRQIREDIMVHPEVRGVYDIFLDNYGPEKFIGYLHIEVDETLTAKDINVLTRAIQTEIYTKYNIALTIGIYAINSTDPEISKMSARLKTLLLEKPEILQIHALYFDKINKRVSFDLVIDFTVRNKREYAQQVRELVQKEFPEYACDLQLDTDISLT